MNDQPGSLAAALAQLQTKLPEIHRTQRADVEGETQKGKPFRYTYMYADLASISSAVLPLLGDLGLSFLAKPTWVARPDAKHEFVLAYSLMHTSGEREDGEYPLPDRGSPQALGAAITYGRRYCLCAVTGVASEEDDDGVAAEAEAATKKGTAQRATPRQAKPHQAQEAPPKGPTAQRKQAQPPPLPTDGDPDQITGPQLAKLAIMFNEVGWTEREDKLRAASTVVGRQLGSSKDLTKAEASGLMDLLKECAGQDDPAQALTEKLEAIKSAEGGLPNAPALGAP